MPKKTLPTATADVARSEHTEKPLRFEERFSRLEEIVRLLDTTDTPLEEMLRLYEEGIALSRECATILQNAEQKILILKNGALQEQSE